MFQVIPQLLTNTEDKQPSGGNIYNSYHRESTVFFTIKELPQVNKRPTTW